VRGLREAARGDLFGACRSLVIAAALFMALLGFASDRAAATARISDAGRSLAVSRVDGTRIAKRRKGAVEAELLGTSAGSSDLAGRLSILSGHGMVLRSSVTLSDANKADSTKANRAGRDGA
jgi:hypothetical protein